MKLLAPNGNKSNLTAKQYELVRTTEFKAWFGDWENLILTKLNDSGIDEVSLKRLEDGVSKVLDENGEPLVVYHYTNIRFNEFRLKGLSDAFFFTKYKNDDEFSYEQTTTKKYFLNIKNMHEVIDIPYYEWSIPYYESQYIKKGRLLGADGLILTREGFDNNFNLIPEKSIILSFNPTQIKLADGSNTTFDSNNPDIRFDGGGRIREIDVESIEVSDEIGYFNDLIFNELEEDEILEGFVIKYYHIKNIGLVNVQDDKFELGVGYIWGLEVFEEYKGKGFGKKIMEKIFILHPTQYAFRGIATKTSKGFWLNLGAEFDESDEYSFILSKDKLNYSDGGSILLAPNGKPSNLTPEQYKLVRTPAFKEWFGDWENDPENASKVVDSNGEPLVVFHGSNIDFNIFEKSKTNPYAEKQGYFFAFDKKYAESYNSKYVKPFFINIRIKGTFDDDDNLVPFNADGNIVQGLQVEVYDKKNIKLADGSNTTLDGNNPDIRFDGGGLVYSYIKFKKGEAEGVIAVGNGSQKHTNIVNGLIDLGFAFSSITKEEYESYDEGDEFSGDELKDIIMKKGGGVDSPEKFEIYQIVESEYTGNLGLGYYSKEVSNPFQNSTSVYDGFLKLTDAFDSYFSYLKDMDSENRDFILKRYPKSNYQIIKLSWDGKSYEAEELLIKKKIVFSINIKQLAQMTKNNTFELGGTIDSSKFKEWFKDSKVVNEKGEPLVVYHQTQEKFDVFDIKKSYTHSFWFTSNLDNILRGETGATQRPNAEIFVMEVYLSVQNMASWDEYDKYSIGELVSMGYDGIKLDDDYVVFEPTQIKSANDNNGNFNPKNPKITMRQGGAIYEDLSLKKTDVINDPKSKRNISIPEVDIVIKKDKKFAMSPKISSSVSAVEIFRLYWDTERINVQELLYVAMLNNQNEVISIYHHSKGSIASTTLDVELISAAAVKSLARGVIIAHNHPSGALKFSEADKKITEKLKCALKLFDVSVLDSLVITEHGYVSMADEGLMSFESGGSIPKLYRGGDVESYNKWKGIDWDSMSNGKTRSKIYRLLGWIEDKRIDFTKVSEEDKEYLLEYLGDEMISEETFSYMHKDEIKIIIDDYDVLLEDDSIVDEKSFLKVFNSDEYKDLRERMTEYGISYRDLDNKKPVDEMVKEYVNTKTQQDIVDYFLLTDDGWKELDYISNTTDTINVYDELLDSGAVFTEEAELAQYDMFNEDKITENTSNSDEVIFIEYLNKDKNHQKDKKYFKSHEEAVAWGKSNFDKFSPDMISHEAVNEEADKEELNKLVRGLKAMVKSTKLASEKKELEQLVRGLTAML
jgi:DNA repair protein RadC